MIMTSCAFINHYSMHIKTSLDCSKSSMSVIIRLTLTYLAVSFMVSQSTAIPQDLVLTLTESDNEPIQEVFLDVKFYRNITLVPGHSYEINCNNKMGGFGGQSSVWFHFNDTPVQQLNATPVNMSVVYAMEVDINSWKLALQQFRETDSGVYTCRGPSNSVSLDIRPGNPTVLSSIPEQRLHNGIQHGSRPTLVAFISGTPRPSRSNITWYFNDQSLPSSIIQDGKELLLPGKIGFNLAGRYTCQVTTSAGTASEDFLITVIRQPDVVLSPMDGQLVVTSEDDAVTVLTCSDMAGVPTPSFNWTRTDNPITMDGHIMILNSNTQHSLSVLTIDPVLPHDSGWYKCTAFNDAGSSSQRIYIEVQFKPILKAYLSSALVRAVVGSNATLQTILVDANPIDTISIQWLRPSGDLIPDSQYSIFNTTNGTVYTVKLVNLTPSSGGIYICEVGNSIGISSINFTLLVIVPPTLNHTDGSTKIRTVLTRNGGQQVTLTAVQFGSIPPIADGEISWNKSDFGQERRIHNDSVKYNVFSSDDSSLLSLTIISPIIEDSGLYTITITNEAGTVSLHFQLEVLDPPAPPIMLNATSVSPCVVEVKWTLPDHQPNSTAAPAYILIEASLSGSTKWTEIGYSTVNTTESRMNIHLGILNATNTVNELYLRARSGNDTGYIGVGEYHTENATFSFVSDVPDPPTGIKEAETSNETTVLKWRAPYSCAIPYEAPSTCDTISYYLITCHFVVESNLPVTVKVSGEKNCATVPLKRGERYKCSVQARNRCHLLSNHSDSIEIYVPADDVTKSGKINNAVIIGVVLTAVTVLIFLSITAVCCALFLQHNRSKPDVTSPTTSIQWENTATDHSESNDLHTTDDVTGDVITYSTLKEVCIQLADLRKGLPTGGWEQEKNNEL